MSGFFNIKQYEYKSTNVIGNTISKCGLCKLHKYCKTPRMKATGEGKKGILIIAEAPGEKEDQRGIQLIGRSGRRVRITLKKLGIDLDRDCRKINAINCRPRKNKTPTPKQIEACRPKVIKEIKNFKPKLIIALGSIALKSVLGHNWNEDLGGINKWRGYTFPYYDYNCWFSSTFHPSFIERDKQGDAFNLIFTEDIKNALKFLNKELPEEEDLESKILLLKKNKEVKEVFTEVFNKKPSLISFDYETTGLKPQAKGHEIVTCSICYSKDKAYSFKLTNPVKSLLVKLLKHKAIYKIAANMKFEEMWSRVILNTSVNNWIWDTMLATHCLDNRPGITSLKFQALVNWGIWDYDSHISPYLKSENDNANSFNNIKSININDLLIYNGIDSLLTYRLALKQMLMMGILDPFKYTKNKKIDIKNIHEQYEKDEVKNRKRLKRKVNYRNK